MARTRLPWQLRWYRATLALSSAEFRARFRDEAVGSLAMALASERERRGRAAAFWLWLRAMGDAVRSIVRDRRRAVSSRGPRRAVFGGWSLDIRQSIRGLRRSPHYSGTVALTLALAIGGVSAVFRLADPLLFQRLPFPQADRLQMVSVRVGAAPALSQFPDYFRIERAGLFAGMGTFYGPIPAALDGAQADADDSLAFAVTNGFLEMLGARIARGRAFLPAEYATTPVERGVFDSAPGAPVLITDALWASQFGRRDDVVGQRLLLESRREKRSMTVVGVLSPDFVLPSTGYKAPVLLVPGRLDASAENDKRSVVTIYGRLRPGVTAEAAASQLALIMSGVETDYPTLPQRRTGTLVSLEDALFGPVRVPLLMLLSITAGVLILAVGNLTHLSLARRAERAREVSVRSALGGGRWRITRLLVTEGLVLAVSGTLMAIALSHAMFVSVMAVVPRLAHVYRLAPAVMNMRVVIFASALGAMAWLVFGVGPSLRTTGADVRGALQLNSRGVRGRGRGASRLLTGMQAALGTSVLVVMILLLGSFVRLVSSVGGIDESGLIVASVELPRDYAAAPERRKGLLRALESRAELASGQPIGWQGGVPGTTVGGGLWRTADLNLPAVAMAYPADKTAMEAFRLRLKAGRLFTDEEAHSNAPVAVIDQRASEILWPGESPIGRLVYDAQVRSEGANAREVVGLVETLRIDFTSDPSAAGRAFVPFHPKSSFGALTWRGTARVAVVQPLRDALGELEPRARLKVAPFEPFERRFGEPRLLARLTSVLGVLALILTIAGAYSVTSHAVSGRTSEIGVRMALGATAGGVKRMILREALTPAVVGVGAGVIAAALWAKTIETLLFQLTARDPLVYAASAVLILGVVALAGLIPAARASRINPTEALRAD